MLTSRSILKFLNLPWTKEMKYFLVTHTNREKPRIVMNSVSIFVVLAYCIRNIYPLVSITYGKYVYFDISSQLI
jgi:hypothetical protein